MTDYYDLVLGLIPLSLATITGALTVAGLGLTIAVPLASTVALGLVGHAMFGNPPVDTAEPSVESAQSPDASFSAD
jgi:hypothetical protein